MSSWVTFYVIMSHKVGCTTHHQNCNQISRIICPNSSAQESSMTYSPVHEIFVNVIFLDLSNFPSFLKIERWKITCTDLCFSIITWFLYRVMVKYNDWSIKKSLFYKIFPYISLKCYRTLELFKNLWNLGGFA